MTDRATAHWTATRTEDLLRGKQVAIRPADGAVLLRALGILNADGSLPPQRVSKYFQINHMVATLTLALSDLRRRHSEVRILDAGCGRSYLSMLLAWCGARVWNHRVLVLGVDRNPAIIAECHRRAELAGTSDVVRFANAALDRLDVAAAWDHAFTDGGDRIHMVVGLHACDTASCAALALGIELGAELIALAPCCQAELSRGWAALADHDTPGDLAPLWQSPHLRRETAAHVTDLMRALILRAHGYQVTALEFVPHEHTRKNTMIRAIRGDRIDPVAAHQYARLVAATGGVGLAVAERLATLDVIGK